MPPADTYWYGYWDVCARCRHVQHYEKAKTWPGQNQNQNIDPARPKPLEHDFFQEPAPKPKPKPVQEVSEEEKLWDLGLVDPYQNHGKDKNNDPPWEG
jgi:hypothetical protein